MQATSPHLLLLGCPFRGLDALARNLGELPGWVVPGDLRLTAAATAGELQDLYAHSQEQLPPDLLRILDLYYPEPSGADPALRLQHFLSQRQDLPASALIRELMVRGLPARSVLVETEGCLRLQALERWLDLSIGSEINLRFVHVVEPAAEFAAAATAVLKDRLFIPPDYRSHTGLYPQLEPQLGWYRIHRNIEILFASLPEARKTRVARSALDTALQAGGAPALLRCLLLAGPPNSTAAERPSASEPEISAMEQRYGFWA